MSVTRRSLNEAMAGDPGALIELPLTMYSRARSLGFSLESAALRLLARAVPGREKFVYEIDRKRFLRVRESLDQLFQRDAANIRKGVYPVSVLLPESPGQHLLRLPQIVWDGFRVERRKGKGRTTEFSDEAKDFAQDSPRYYRRNFHFQTDGYLSEQSAALYDHQVELLFAGGGDAMRRLILAPLRERFGSSDGKGLSFLEIAAGTGSATRFLALAFPKARIVALDLSAPYLNFAKQRLRSFSRVSLLQGDGAHLPFKDQEFDAVVSVFLFHELPLEARLEVLRESARVLKPAGFIGLVDSVQTGDSSDLDDFLARFPEFYHEPFYRNYLAHPMQELLRQVVPAASNVQTEVGFFSKVVWATTS